MPITKASSSAVAPGAKGDLVVGNATNDSGILAVGSTDQVLTVDSSTATGLKWAAIPTPASGGMTLLSTTTLSGATTTLSSIDQTYIGLFIKIYGMTNDSANTNFIFKPNGTNSLAVGTKIEGTTVGQYEEQNIQLNNSSSGLLRTGGDNVWGITIMNYSNAAKTKTYTYEGYMVNSASTNFYGVLSSGGIKTSSAITSLQFSTASGNSFTGGTVLLYGVK